MRDQSQLVSRAGIRASRDDMARIASDGWSGWVNAQLAMPFTDGDTVRDAIAGAKLHIEYEAGDGYKALKEDRPITQLHAPVKDLWHLVSWETKMAWNERVRPADELVAATHIRAAVSDAQLRESVTDFWRDHFSVNRDAVEDVAVTLPFFDQEILRRHALGNFRELVEAVATSTAMLAYLNNASSKASPANENYARELFELHTLGANAYLNNHYDRWREVPGAIEGKPEGFIDQDVYEAARAFTGWTYANGQWISEGVELPRTGEFHYNDAWHDPYQKRILATELDPYQPPMSDGRAALDLAAFHPATAEHVARRLCTRYVADLPSQELINSTARVFMDNARAADQIAQTIRHVLMSEEFAQSPSRLQRPMFLFASMQRGAATVLPPGPDLPWMIDGMGQKLYTWPSPAGHPLQSAYWQSPGLLVRRWRMINEMWQKLMAQNESREWQSIPDFVAEWSGVLQANEQQKSRAAVLMRDQFGQEERGVSFKPDDRWVVGQVLGYLSSTPNYQAV